MKNLLLITFSLFTCYLFGQNNFRPAVLTFQGGETVQGEINFKDWYHNPRLIEYRIGQNKPTKTANPLELRRFEVEGEVYVGAKVMVDLNPNIAEKSNFNPTSILGRDTIFLRALIEGDKSLYELFISQSKVMFYIPQNDTFSLLEYRTFHKNCNGKMIKAEVTGFRIQLNGYLDDCSKLYDAIDETKYDARSLQNIYQKHYTCKGISPNFVIQQKKVSVECNVMAGESFSQVNFDLLESSFPDFTVRPFNTSADVTAGLGLMLVLPKLRKKVSFGAELWYYGFENSNSNGLPNTNFAQFGFDIAKFNAVLMFKPYRKKIEIQTLVGMANNFVVSTRSNRSHPFTYAIPSFRTYETGYFVGAGIQWKRFFLQTRFEKAGGFSNLIYLNDSRSIFTINTGFQLIGQKKKSS